LILVFDTDRLLPVSWRRYGANRPDSRRNPKSPASISPWPRPPR